jgi:hypothetical protein
MIHGVIIGGHIGEIGVADFSLLVPPEHRVDCLGKLAAAGFIDAASVNPGVIQAIFQSLVATILDFGVS